MSVGDFLTTNWFGKILGFIIIIFIFFQIIDLIIILPYNIINGTTSGNCADPDKWTNILNTGLFSKFFKKECPPDQPEEDGSKTCGGGVGRWKDYEAKGTDGTKKGFICGQGATRLFNDTLSTHVVGGYTATELLSYVIIPTFTILGIMYGLVFTRLSYAEWIFWILIGTLIYTGLTSIAYDADINILPPDQPSPLTYITDKLNFAAADELKYQFMARKADGTECLVDGVILGGGIHPAGQEPTYTGSCTAESLPLT